MSRWPDRLAVRALRTRWLVRAPLLLYRAGLGVLLGERFLMLEHVGRSSGLVRRVVLEVVDRPAPGVYVVVSGLGPGSQWYRNVRAEPRVRVSCGRRRGVPARAVLLDEAGAERALAGYRAAHPRAYDRLGRVLEAAQGVPLRSLPAVRLEPERPQQDRR